MQTLKEVKKEEIFKKAKSIIQRAQKEILVTMDLAEELRSPLPLEYFFLLEERMKIGVKIRRLAFGEKEDFKKFNKKTKINKKNYCCKLVTEGDYKRMLLTDRKKLLFAVEKDDGRHYYYTENLNIINDYLRYFYNF